TETAYQSQRAALEASRSAAPIPPTAAMPALPPPQASEPPQGPPAWPVPSAAPVPLPAADWASGAPAETAWPVSRAEVPASRAARPARPDLAYRTSGEGAPGGPRAVAAAPPPPAPPPTAGWHAPHAPPP